MSRLSFMVMPEPAHFFEVFIEFIGRLLPHWLKVGVLAEAVCTFNGERQAERFHRSVMGGLSEGRVILLSVGGGGIPVHVGKVGGSGG